MKKVNVGSDFSGVGAFDLAIGRVASHKGFEVNTIFACDMDKYARTTYVRNHGQPEYYPENVYDRIIPNEPLTFYMTSPPCQAFSMAGKRLGKDDTRGILFFNSLEFINTNNPRYFIFENVKGLLSDNGGKTFSEWINLLGGKSVNGLPVIFPYEDSVPYHIYWQVLNAKNHGIPQNRERVFIIGIRDDADNNFRFPIDEPLTKKLRDVLDDCVDEKYYLSQKMIDGFMAHNENHEKKGTGFIFTPKTDDDVANCLRANGSLCATDNTIKVKSNNALGYEIASDGDVICYENLNSKTRRGRVGHQVAQTIDTAMQQAVLLSENKTPSVKQLNQSNESNGKQPYQQNRIYDTDGISPALMSNLGGERSHNILCTNEVIKVGQVNDSQSGQIYSSDGIAVTQMAGGGGMGAKTGLYQINFKVRRLTPRECFRLMDFPDSFDISCVSDTQAYKQAGNSIVVRVLEKIIANLQI